MENQLKSSSQVDIENRMQSIDEGSLRYTVLEKSRQFKSSWIELAASLAQVAKQKSFLEWGYESLENYCLKELHIRKNTAAKLIGNYNFLSKHEPEILTNNKSENIPDLKAIEILAKLKENGTINEDAYTDIREAALTKQYSPSTLNKKLKALENFRTDNPEALNKRLRSLTNSIRRLLHEKGEIPDKIEDSIKSIENYIDE